MANKDNIIPGDVYMKRDGIPALLVTNRLYALSYRRNGKETTYSVAAPGVTAARRATQTERAANAWVDYGYLMIVPEVFSPTADHYGDLRKINIQSVLDDDRLPLGSMLPTGYKFLLVTALSSLLGEYGEIRERDAAANAQAAKLAEKRRTAYNELATAANELLGDQPIPLVPNAWDEAPAAFSLNATQLRRLVEANPTAV